MKKFKKFCLQLFWRFLNLCPCCGGGLYRWDHDKFYCVCCGKRKK